MAQRLRQGLFLGQKWFADAVHHVRALEEDLKARREIDVAGMVAGLRARLFEQLKLEALPIASDLADRELPRGLGRVRAEAWRSDRLRKIVLSHFAVPGIIEGLALTALPKSELAAPCFAADFLALPWRLSVHADVYGTKAQTRDALRGMHTTFVKLGSGSGPAWAQSLGSGHGLHAKLRPRQVEEGFAALSQGMYAYLVELADCAAGDCTEAQQQFFQAFHEFGPRRGMLRRLFGDAWAERYSRLVFE